MKKEIRDLQFEVDVLKEVVQVIKKDPSVNWIPHRFREKIVIVDALENRYARSKLLAYLAFPPQQLLRQAMSAEGRQI